MLELLRIFVDVLTPVLAVAAVGAFAAKIWSLDYRPLSTIAYHFLAPAFVFRILVDPSGFDGPILGMIGATIATVVIVFVFVRVLLRNVPEERRVLDSMLGTFGNVGNLGFPIVLFALGDAALPEAGIHFLATTIGVFVLGIAAAARLRASTATRAIRRVITTPVIAVAPFAIAFNVANVTLAPFAERFMNLLADAMIPVMLLTLGMQLMTVRVVPDVRRLGVLTLVKLAVAPAVFFGVSRLIGLTGDARNAGLLLAAMPSAVFVALISLEFDLESEVASAAILVTSLISIGTLGVLISLL